MRKHIPRLLPTLIALPIPEFRKHALSKRLVRPSDIERTLESNQSETKEIDVSKSAIFAAIDALQAVIALTHSFLKDAPDNVTEPEEWLARLAEVINFLEDALHLGLLDFEQHVTIETEGVDSLDEVLRQIPDFEEYFNENLNSLSRKLLCFWLNEIERRGWELFHICISSVDVCQAGLTFQTMKELRYPIA